MNISIFGIGKMGLPIARRLCEAGHTVTVWNRSRDKALPLQAHGAQVAHTAAQAAAAAECAVLLLTDGDAVAQVLFGDGEGGGVAQALPRGALVVDMSSIRPAQAREHAERLARLGIRHIDAPVSGGTVGAEQGQLAIMAGGDAGDFAQAEPLFAALGRATHVGPHGAGQLAKLANQMIVGGTIGIVAEALLLAAKGGADMAQVRAAIRGGFAESRVLELHGQRMVQRDFAQRGALSIQLKDMRNALTTAEALGFDAPVTRHFEALYAQAVEHGLGALDHSALFVELAQRNGMS